MRYQLLVVALGAVNFSICWAAPSVRIIPALVSPQPVGTVIGLTAIPKDEGMPMALMPQLRFRYSVSVDGAPFQIVRDFSPQNNFAWRPDLFEHEALIKVTLYNVATKSTADSEVPFQIVRRIKGQKPMATATASPLVALFSAPPCPQGSQTRVAFRREGSSAEWSRTSTEPCTGKRTNNIYVGGMRGDSDYDMHAEVMTVSASKPGPPVKFHTGISDGATAPMGVLVPRDSKASSAEPLLIYSIETGDRRPIATDLEGNLVWYLPQQDRSLTRMLAGGRFLVYSGGINRQNSKWQVLSEVDLAGNVIRETNIDRLAQQLESRGIHSVCKPNGQQCIPGFHHDAIRLTF